VGLVVNEKDVKIY